MRIQMEKVMHAVFSWPPWYQYWQLRLSAFFLFANGLPAMGEIGFRDFLLGRLWAPMDLPQSFGIFQ